MFFTPEDLQAYAAPVATVVRSALEDGLARLPAVMKVMGIPPNPWFAADVIRSRARHCIEEAQPKFGEPWMIDRSVPNAGIHLNVAVGPMRVVRGDLLRVPSPGHSKEVRDFYSQGILDLWNNGGGVPDEPVRMLMLWSPQFDGTISLSMVIPKSTWKFGAKAQLHAAAALDENGVVAGEFDSGEDDYGLVAKIAHEGSVEEL